MENERGRKEKRHGGEVNNSDTEAPLSGVDGGIFNKACASEPLRLLLTPDPASLNRVLLVLLL